MKRKYKYLLSVAIFTLVSMLEIFAVILAFTSHNILMGQMFLLVAILMAVNTLFWGAEMVKYRKIKKR